MPDKYVVVSSTSDCQGLAHSKDDEPSCVWGDGLKQFYFHDKLHRTFGQAEVFDDHDNDDFWVWLDTYIEDE